MHLSQKHSDLQGPHPSRCPTHAGCFPHSCTSFPPTVTPAGQENHPSPLDNQQGSEVACASARDPRWASRCPRPGLRCRSSCRVAPANVSASQLQPGLPEGGHGHIPRSPPALQPPGVSEQNKAPSKQTSEQRLKRRDVRILWL